MIRQKIRTLILFFSLEILENHEISEFLKFSNLKNLVFFGKYIVGEPKFVSICSTPHDQASQLSRETNFSVRLLHIERFLRFENFKNSEILFAMHSFFCFFSVHTGGQSKLKNSTCSCLCLHSSAAGVHQFREAAHVSDTDRCGLISRG